MNSARAFFVFRESGVGGPTKSILSEALKSVMPYAKVRYRMFTAAFEASLEQVSINGLDMLSEDLQDA
jgi:hypothetical protein